MSEDLTLTVRVPIEVRVSADGWSHGVEGGRAKLVARSDPEKPVPGMRMEHPWPDGLLPRLVVDGFDRRAAVCWEAFLGDFVGLELRAEPGEPLKDSARSPCLLLTASGELPTEFEGMAFLDPDSTDDVHRFRATSAAGTHLGLESGLVIPFRGRCRSLPAPSGSPLLLDERGEVVAALAGGSSIGTVFGFDPIRALAEATREDATPWAAATNGNWIIPILHAYERCFPLAVRKGLWPGDVPPILYSVDTEAGTKYYDPAAGRCTWAARRRRAREPRDTKLEESLRTCASRLEAARLVGTFHIDLNAVRDPGDRDALRKLVFIHDAALHLPAIGGHDDWVALVADSGATEVALLQGSRTLEELTGAPAIGFRCPSWKRASTTHDAVAAAGLGYDSSSFAHPPYLVVPYRMFSSGEGEPVELWQLPCMEVIGAVKAGPSRWRGLRTRRRHAADIDAFVETCAKRGSMCVLCDHDMSLGAARGHQHGTWRVDTSGLRSVLASATRAADSGMLRQMRSRDFFAWWMRTRRARFRLTRVGDSVLDLRFDWR